MIKIVLAMVGASVVMFSTMVFGATCGEGISAMTASNYSKAVEILQPLADTGDSCAQLQLGKIYKFGLSGQKDLEKARTLFSKAAAQGNSEAKVFLDELEK